MAPYKAGFTLLEVLIALMVLAMVMGGFVYQLQYHSQLTWQVNEKIIAGRWLNNKFNHLALTPQTPKFGIVKETIAFNNYHWLFTYHTEATMHDQLVHVTLSLEKIDGPVVYVIEGYLLDVL